MGIDTTKKEKAREIQTFPKMSIDHIDYDVDSGYKIIHYNIDGIKKTNKELLTHKDIGLVNKRNKLSTIDHNINNMIDKTIYTNLFKSYNDNLQKKPKCHDELNTSKLTIIIQIVNDCKKLHNNHSNSCIRLCSLRLRNYLSNELDNYTHISIPTQLIPQLV